ncbi:MAG: cytochrome C oxidase subunit IV family protein [Balneolaceae bacterium]|nr:cytochrome C oxidase subunit IV family protein [Balneolaceae bacterium]MBO6546912.1 cytochrome C oxidase subunit IV family protein [Balneolaceae bacterium]MBO6649272.1 cytochrome C oxidase subunit IV family protein [Balneolaceae bacterium]
MSEHNHEHHVATAKQLWLIGGALFVLTILTVVVSSIPIPAPFDIITALVIAFGKAYLVAAFFMGLYWDVKFNSMLLIGALVFFILMVTVTLLDTMYRQDVVPSF